MDMGCLIAGVRMNTGVRLARPDASASRAVADYLEGVLGLSHRLWHELPGPQGSTSLVLRAEAREALMPGHDTLNLRQALDPVVHDLDRALEREIAVALLGGPQVFTFESLGAFASHVRVQRRICRAAARTAVAFKTLAAERPDQYWTYDEEAGFLLQPGQSLSDALRAATQPSVTGQLYDFSCYRASEYVILLGLSEELEQVIDQINATGFDHFAAQRCTIRLNQLLQAIARTTDGEALLVQEIADAPNHQHLMVLVVTAVASAFDRPQLRELLLPITQHMRFDTAQLGHFTNGEIPFGRDRWQRFVHGSFFEGKVLKLTSTDGTRHLDFLTKFAKKKAAACAAALVWRSGRDSNPRPPA
mgnify:CR=1 FL=1